VSIAVAVVDSGIHAGHPHVGNVAGGVGFDEDGRPHEDWTDRLGHGTAVAAAIHEKAPDASLYAVKVFDRVLATRVAALVAAIDWAIAQQVALVNLSLGVSDPQFEEPLRAAVERATKAGVTIVAAVDAGGPRWLPGSLPGVVPVELDWDCPREDVRVTQHDGGVRLRASGYPRPIPGVPEGKNLKGTSFAVANATGILAASKELRRRLTESVLRSPAPTPTVRSRGDCA
jgi:subtilisin family serine protease